MPGAVVECGVWRGGTIGGIASLLGPGREYRLFDSFAGLPPAGDVNGDAARAWQGGIALLRLDADWYESTMSCLDHLFPAVVGGGLVVLDDYHVWNGCSRAVHDCLSARSSTARIDRFAGDVCFLVKRPGA